MTNRILKNWNRSFCLWLCYSAVPSTGQISLFKNKREKFSEKLPFRLNTKKPSKKPSEAESNCQKR